MSKDLKGNASVEPVFVKLNMSKYNEGLLKAMKQDEEDKAAKIWSTIHYEFKGNEDFWVMGPIGIRALDEADCILVDDPHYIAEVDPATGNDMHLDWVWGRNFTPEESRRLGMGGIIPGSQQTPSSGTIGNTTIPEDPATSKPSGPSEFWDEVYKKAFDSQKNIIDDKPVVDMKIRADTPDEQNRIWDLLKEAARG